MEQLQDRKLSQSNTYILITILGRRRAGISKLIRELQNCLSLFLVESIMMQLDDKSGPIQTKQKNNTVSKLHRDAYIRDLKDKHQFH